MWPVGNVGGVGHPQTPPSPARRTTEPRSVLHLGPEGRRCRWGPVYPFPVGETGTPHAISQPFILYFGQRTADAPDNCRSPPPPLAPGGHAGAWEGAPTTERGGQRAGGCGWGCWALRTLPTDF